MEIKTANKNIKLTIYRLNSKVFAIWLMNKNAQEPNQGIRIGINNLTNTLNIEFTRLNRDWVVIKNE